MKVIDNFGVVNQYVISDKSRLCFQSYNTLIAEYNIINHELILYKYFDYSSTTSKYLHKFLNGYVNNNIYDFIKKHDIKKEKQIIYNLSLSEISIIYKENE